MDTTTKVLNLIRESGPITARSIADKLLMSEKQARSCIDRLRFLDYHIWLDPVKGFWWSNDLPPSNDAYLRWKRTYNGPHAPQSLAPKADMPVLPSCENRATTNALRNGTSKQIQYADLVQRRKACDLCHGLTNVAKYPEFDSAQIGPWTRWQGNLGARLMVVGQDWADASKLAENEGRPLPRFDTNRNLVSLLAVAGVSIDPPTKSDTSGSAFFTNAILCLKPDMKTSIDKSWLQNCSRFLEQTIRIVEPKVVVAAGAEAWKTLQRTFGRGRLVSLSMSLEQMTPWELWSKGPKAFGVFHPGGLGTAQRPLDVQQEDWRAIGQYLREMV